MPSPRWPRGRVRRSFALALTVGSRSPLPSFMAKGSPKTERRSTSRIVVRAQTPGASLVGSGTRIFVRNSARSNAVTPTGTDSPSMSVKQLAEQRTQNDYGTWRGSTTSGRGTAFGRTPSGQCTGRSGAGALSVDAGLRTSLPLGGGVRRYALTIAMCLWRCGGYSAITATRDSGRLAMTSRECAERFSTLKSSS